MITIQSREKGMAEMLVIIYSTKINMIWKKSSDLWYSFLRKNFKGNVMKNLAENLSDFSFLIFACDVAQHAAFNVCAA